MDLPSLNFTDVIHSTPINQDAVVAAVAAVNPHTIVVLENGGAQVMPWLGSVGAVLEAWFRASAAPTRSPTCCLAWSPPRASCP